MKDLRRESAEKLVLVLRQRTLALDWVQRLGLTQRTTYCGCFGATVGGGLGFRLCGDVWRYNIATKIWTWVSGRLSFAEIYHSESAQLKVPSKTSFPATLYSSSAAVDNSGDVW